MSIRDVTDGTTNALMVGERASYFSGNATDCYTHWVGVCEGNMDASGYKAARGRRLDGVSHQHGGVGELDVPVVVQQPAPGRVALRPRRRLGCGSWSENVDFTLYKNLSSIADGKIVGEFLRRSFVRLCVLDLESPPGYAAWTRRAGDASRGGLFAFLQRPMCAPDRFSCVSFLVLAAASLAGCGGRGIVPDLGSVQGGR